MSLREDLDLDIAEAQRRIDRIEGQLGQAARSFGNTLQAQLDRIRGLDVGVTLVPDAGAVTIGGQEAVDAIDAHVPIDADASRAREEVDSVTSRVEVLRGALQRTVALLAGGALLAGFANVGIEYNALTQRTLAAYTTILGSSREALGLLEEIREFSRSSPFPRQAFQEATQTLLAFGFAGDRIIPTLSAIQDAVAATGQGADAISELTRILSVVNSTGKITAETLNQLGLRGVNAARIIAQQMGSTEAAIRSSITNGTLDAREALDALVVGMQAQFEGAADGVKRTFDGAVDRVKGAVRDISSTLLEGFINPEGGGIAVAFANQIADLLRIIESELAGDLGQSLGEMAGSFIPALINALVALLPLLSSGTQLLVALTPIVQTLGAALSAIPVEVLTAVAAFRAMTLVMGPLYGGFSSVVGLTGRALPAFSAMHPAVLAVTSALTLLTVVSARNAARERERAAAVANVRTAMSESIPTIEAYSNAVEGATESDSKLVAALNEMGLTVEQFVTDITDGALSVAALGEEIQRLESRLSGSRAVADPDRFRADEAELARLKALRDQIRAIEDLAAAELEAGVTRGDWTARQRDAAIEATRLADGTANAAAAYALLRDEFLLTSAATARASASLESLGIDMAKVLRLTEAVTDAYQDFTGAAEGALLTAGSAFRSAADASDRYERSTERSRSTTERFTKSLADARRALEEALRPASARDLERSELRHERALNAREDAAQKVLDAERALANAAVEAARTGEPLSAVRARLERELRDARLAAREAVIAEADAQDALTETRLQGTAVDERVIAAKERLAQVTRDAADAQVEAARKNLEAATIDRAAATERELTAADVVDALEETAERIAEFHRNLRTIADAGFTEAAGILATQGADTAGAVATEIAKAVAAGDTSLASGMNTWGETLRTENSKLRDYLRNELGIRYVAETDAIAGAAVDAFGKGFDLRTPTQIAAALAFDALDEEGQILALLAGRVGENAARALAEDFQLDEDAKARAIQVGVDLMGGVGVGIEREQERVMGIVTDAAERTLERLASVFEIRSPSRATARFGRDLMAGLGLGIRENLDATLREADRAGRSVSVRLRDALAPPTEPLGRFVTRTPQEQPNMAGAAAGIAGTTPGGVHVDQIIIQTNNPEAGIRHAFQELESIGRRGGT